MRLPGKLDHGEPPRWQTARTPLPGYQTGGVTWAVLPDAPELSAVAPVQRGGLTTVPRLRVPVRGRGKPGHVEGPRVDHGLRGHPHPAPSVEQPEGRPRFDDDLPAGVDAPARVLHRVTDGLRPVAPEPYGDGPSRVAGEAVQRLDHEPGKAARVLQLQGAFEGF